MLCYVIVYCSVYCMCYDILCYVMICYDMLCYVVLYYVMLYYVMLCYIMLSHVMLCCVMLWATCADFLYVFRKSSRLHERKLWFLYIFSADGTILRSLPMYLWADGVFEEY